MSEEWLDVLESRRKMLDFVKWDGWQVLTEWPWQDAPEHWVDRLLLLATQAHTSHVFLDPVPEGGGRLCFRVDGVVLPGPAFSPEQYQHLVSAIHKRAALPDSDPATLFCDGIIQGSAETGEHGFVVGILRTAEGHQVTLCTRSPLPYAVPWEGWPDEAITALEQMRRHPNGLIVFCHRGYSSEIGSMLKVFDHMARESHGGSRYACVTDTVLRLAPRDGVSQVRVEGSKESWEAALRALAAQDTDVFALAGRNENEVVSQALLTALEDRGVLVNVSLPGVVDSLLWLLSALPVDAAQVAEVLLGVIGSYGGLRRVCPVCASPAIPDESVLPLLGTEGITSIPEGNWVQGKGCEECNGTGYTPVYATGSVRSQLSLSVVETIYIDREFARFCASHPSRSELLSALSERGFRTYFQQAFDLAQQGLTTLQEAIRVGLARRADL